MPIILYKYLLCLCFNKSVLYWTFYQLLLRKKKNPIARKKLHYLFHKLMKIWQHKLECFFPFCRSEAYLNVECLNVWVGSYYALKCLAVVILLFRDKHSSFFCRSIKEKNFLYDKLYGMHYKTTMNHSKLECLSL